MKHYLYIKTNTKRSQIRKHVEYNMIEIMPKPSQKNRFQQRPQCRDQSLMTMRVNNF